MSLRDAVEEVAKDMEEYNTELARNCGDNREVQAFVVVFAGFAKMLRIALKSSEGEQSSPYPFSGNTPILLPQTQHEVMIEKARQEFRIKGKVLNEEEAGGRMVECRGGSANDAAVPIVAGMPTGAKTFVLGEIYQLGEDGFLHFLQLETDTYKEYGGNFNPSQYPTQ